jgi:LuxR family transcriptional regulator, activator of conjugal transfer of Ti plasmids
MESVILGPAATKLTHKILGLKTEDLLDILKQLGPELGLSHISYIRLASNKSLDSSFLTAMTTYPKEWQRRYFAKQYFLIDPIVAYGSTSLSHFDWIDLERGNQVIKDFFSDAVRYQVGSNGLSIPVRNRKNTCAIVSFTTDMPRSEWEIFKNTNMDKLYHASALIDSAAITGAKLPNELEVNLSLREEQCLMWAARGKTYEEIGEITNLSFYSVRSHLDVARSKLHGANLTHAVAIALTLGVIPPIALRETV